ncbi:MAG: hypothetical protein HC888_14540 [Candidatus Competibacteraceae bacterium]|nr:hypothetical protein [Candidatus Competibacteraceae bacterium]
MTVILSQEELPEILDLLRGHGESSFVYRHEIDGVRGSLITGGFEEGCTKYRSQFLDMCAYGPLVFRSIKITSTHIPGAFSNTNS